MVELKDKQLRVEDALNATKVSDVCLLVHKNHLRMLILRFYMFVLSGSN